MPTAAAIPYTSFIPTIMDCRCNSPYKFIALLPVKSIESCIRLWLRNIVSRYANTA